MSFLDFFSFPACLRASTYLIRVTLLTKAAIATSTARATVIVSIIAISFTLIKLILNLFTILFTFSKVNTSLR